MIGFNIETSKGDKLRITAPHSWREITIDQLIKIEDDKLQEDGLIKLFSIICSVEFGLVAESTDRTLFNRIREVCSFVAEPPVWENVPCPKEIEIDGKRVQLPTDVSKLMHGQIELLTEIGKEDDLLKSMPKALAIILQPQMGEGGYDGKQVAALEQNILQASGLEVYGACLFFFQKLASFLNTGISNSVAYHKANPRSKKYYTNWLKVNDLIATPQ